jgi:hypothetical protein
MSIIITMVSITWWDLLCSDHLNKGEHPHDVIHFPASNRTTTVGKVAWFPYCKSKQWSCKYYDRVMEPAKKFWKLLANDTILSHYLLVCLQVYSLLLRTKELDNDDESTSTRDLFEHTEWWPLCTLGLPLRGFWVLPGWLPDQAPTSAPSIGSPWWVGCGWTTAELQRLHFHYLPCQLT